MGPGRRCTISGGITLQGEGSLPPGTWPMANPYELRLRVYFYAPVGMFEDPMYSRLFSSAETFVPYIFTSFTHNKQISITSKRQNISMFYINLNMVGVADINNAETYFGPAGNLDIHFKLPVGTPQNSEISYRFDFSF